MRYTLYKCKLHFSVKCMGLCVTWLNRVGLWRQSSECSAGTVYVRLRWTEPGFAGGSRVVNAVLGLCMTSLNRAAGPPWRQSYECSAGFVCDLAEERRAVKALLWMQCWVCVWPRWTELQGCKGSHLWMQCWVCVWPRWTELHGCEGIVMNAVLGLCVTSLNRAAGPPWRQSYECSVGFVCDLAEQSCRAAVKALLWMQCWVCVWPR